MYFLGFVQELRFFFFFFFSFSGVAFRVHWAMWVIEARVFVKFGIFSQSFFFFFALFILDSSCWSDLELPVPCVISNPLLSQSSELRFQRIFISIRFFILFLCCNFVSILHSSWKNISVGTLKCLVVPASGLILTLAFVDCLPPFKLRFSWFSTYRVIFCGSSAFWILWDSDLADVCFSRQSSWLCSGHRFWSASCGLWLQDQGF